MSDQQQEIQDIRERRLKLQRNYKLTMLFSFFAKLVSFFLIPVRFEALYCGMAIIAFDLILAVYYGNALKKLNRKELHLVIEIRNSAVPVLNNPQPMLPPSYEESNCVYSISGQPLQHTTDTQQQWRHNMFSGMATVHSADLTLIGPVVGQRTGSPSSQNKDYVVEMPPSYDEAIKTPTNDDAGTS